MSAPKRKRQRNAQLAAIVGVLMDRCDVVWHPLDDCELTSAEYRELAKQILDVIE